VTTVTTGDLIREAAQSLLAHRLRSILATVGIVAGVGTVVAAFAIMDGARAAALADLGALGTDTLIVRAQERVDARGARLAPALSLTDADVLRRRFPGAVSAALRLSPDAALTEARGLAAPLAGVTDTWFGATRLTLARGRAFESTDAHALVAVLGDGIARTLFRGTDPVGRIIYAGGEWRSVIGVLAGGMARTRSSLSLVNADSAIFVPFDTLDLALGSGDAGDAATELLLRLPGGDDPLLAAAEVDRVLADGVDREHPAFSVLIPRELLRARLDAERHTHALLFAIGALALLASGVGIANIMIASVTERAPEIGMRRAVGARRRTILAQVALEAAALGAAGAVIGVPAGLLAASLSARFGGWPVAVSGVSIGAAIVLALATALGAGLYPARLAAAVSPIETLR
jgi:putative ABC transport system permease protein